MFWLRIERKFCILALVKYFFSSVRPTMTGVAMCTLLTPVLLGCGGSRADGEGSNTTTLAGTGEAGLVDGPATSARFHNPVNVAVDSMGTIFVADFDNDRVRKIAADGSVSTLVNQSNFSRPFGLAIGPGDLLYVQTDANDTGERNSTTGTVWKVSRTGGVAVATVIARNLGRPRGLALLSDGDLALSDPAHHVVSRLNVTTGTVSLIAGGLDAPGFTNGTGAAARFNRPYGLTQSADGSLLVADQNNHSIRRITLTGAVSTVSGTGVAGSTDGVASVATFTSPQDVKQTSDGVIYVADTGGHTIRTIRQGATGSVVATFAGTGVRGFADGPRLTAQFWGLEGIAVGKSDQIVIADGTGGDDADPPYNRVRMIKD